MTRTATPSKHRTGRDATPSTRVSTRWVWLLPVSVLAGLLGGLGLAGSYWRGPAPGATDPGALVGWMLPLARVTSVTAATLTAGWLISAVFLAPQGRGGMLSRVGRSDLVRAGWAALVWCLAALATLLSNHAMTVGLPFHEALRPGTLATYVFAVDTNVAFFVAAVCAAVVAVSAPWVGRTGAAIWLLAAAAVGIAGPAVTGHSHGLGDHGLAIASGLVHAWAATAWLGSLVAVAWHVLRRDPGQRQFLPRFSTLVTICLVALAASGLGSAYARVERVGDLFSSGYGALVLLKVALLGLLAWVAVMARRSLAQAGSSAGRSVRMWRWLVVEGMLLGTAIGVAVALTRTPNTRIPVPLPSSKEELLGFVFPPAPSVASVLGGWHPEPFWIIVCGLLLTGYAWGVATLRRRGDAWGWGRTVSWVIGNTFILWATCGQIAAYSVVSVSLHMLQHMILGMFAPVFLVMGAPLTLALRAIRPSRSGDRGPREWLLWTLHTPVSKLVTHPAYVLAVSVLSLYGLYFTGLFPAMMGNHLGHLAMQIHFVLSGYLFYWILIGVDPAARQIPHWLKMIVLLLSLSLHGFFGIAIMMMKQPLGEEWFGLVQPPWLTDLVADTYTAGGIAWALGEIPTMIVMVALSIQWARSDDRLARRIDRAADRDGDADLRAYNEQLARLAARDAEYERQAASPRRPGS